MLNVEAVCQHLQVSRDTVYRLIRTGQLAAKRQPGAKGYWVSPDDLDRFKESGGAEPRPVLSVGEACRLLGCAPETVRRLINDGHLQGYKLGGPRGHFRIPASSVEEYIARNTVVAP